MFLGGADPSAKAVSAVEQDGAFVTIRFKVLGKGGSKCALTLERVQAFDGAGMEMAVKVQSGEVAVGSPLPWPLLGAAAGALVLLVLIFRPRK